MLYIYLILEAETGKHVVYLFDFSILENINYGSVLFYFYMYKT